MYKKLVQMLIDAVTAEDMNKACAEISKAYQMGKISYKDNEHLYDLAAKIDGSFRASVKAYKG